MRFEVDSPLGQEEALSAVASFGRLAEWDPAVSRSRLVSGTELTPGAIYRLESPAWLGKTILTYELLAIDPPRFATYRGGSKSVTSTDTIRVGPSGSGSRGRHRNQDGDVRPGSLGRPRHYGHGLARRPIAFAPRPAPPLPFLLTRPPISERSKRVERGILSKRSCVSTISDNFVATFLADTLRVDGLVAISCQTSTIESERPESPLTSPTLVSTTVTSPTWTSAIAAEVIAAVVSLTDGVTIRVLVPDGSEEPVRLIGIDAPEDGSLLDQKATAFLEGLALEEEVRLLIDVNDRDRLGRLLRYVYVDDVFVNEEMVRAGMAIAKRYEPDTAMASILKAAQSGAEQASLGLFSADLTTTTVAPTTTSLTVATTTSTTIAVTITTVPPQAGCDPSYPDFCIPSPPPDVDCGDIGYKNFTVHSPDPHSFDGNNDGVGCES